MTQKDILRESHYTSGTAVMGDSLFYQTNDSNKLRKALREINSPHNVTLSGGSDVKAIQLNNNNHNKNLRKSMNSRTLTPLTSQ